ncbi:MAG: response regulator [Candidatus Xenobium sp.]|jgi:DNA-binding response OmpR family regulator|nr:response regulator [Burkholderiales bacterium]
MAKKRVLVVEDDDRIRKVEALILTCDPLEVIEAPGGRQALELLRQEKFDLIVLDLMLPEGDGMQVLRAIRQRPETENLPVLLITAQNTELDMLESFKSDANYYITQPFEPRELVDSVELILGVHLED